MIGLANLVDDGAGRKRDDVAANALLPDLVDRLLSQKVDVALEALLVLGVVGRHEHLKTKCLLRFVKWLYLSHARLGLLGLRSQACGISSELPPAEHTQLAASCQFTEGLLRLLIRVLVQEEDSRRVLAQRW